MLTTDDNLLLLRIVNLYVFSYSILYLLAFAEQQTKPPLKLCLLMIAIISYESMG